MGSREQKNLRGTKRGEYFVLFLLALRATVPLCRFQNVARSYRGCCSLIHLQKKPGCGGFFWELAVLVEIPKSKCSSLQRELEAGFVKLALFTAACFGVRSQALAGAGFPMSLASVHHLPPRSPDGCCWENST